MVFILLTVLIDMIAIGLIVPVLPLLVGTFTTSTTEQTFWFGAVALAFGVANFFASPILGALSDKYGRRPLLLLGFAGLALSFIVTGLATALWMLVVVRLVSGAMQSNVAAVSGVVMSRWSDKGHVIAHDQKRQTINLAESTGGVQSVGGTGFGCLLLRRSAMLQATPFHHGGLTGNFDMEFANRVRMNGWLWLMDWSIRCVHGDDQSGGAATTPSVAR